MTYGIPHTVRGWGDMVVTTVEIPPADQIDSYSSVVLRGFPGPVILVPTVALTPVDTTPAEPEPGAWLIGEVFALRTPRSRHLPQWMWHDGTYLDTGTWKELWAKHGAPGITPRRLVPEPDLPEVTLPWHAYDSDGSLATVSAEGIWVKVAVTEDPAGSGDEVAVVEYRADTAERMAAALLRAAREVKP